MVFVCVFFFNDTATTEIYTLSLHDALPIFPREVPPWSTVHHYFRAWRIDGTWEKVNAVLRERIRDRKSTRLNSSHANISYAVFCLKKKKKTKSQIIASQISFQYTHYTNPSS